MPKKTTEKKTPVKKATDAPAKKKAVAKKKAPEKKEPTPSTPKKEAAPAVVKGTTETFSNDQAQVKCTKSEGCKVHLHVELTPVVLSEARSQAVKEVSKGVSIPGFRKGKVPKEIIEKNYASSIEEKLSYILVQKGLDIALELTQLRPLNYRQVQPAIEKEAVFTYEFESYPHVPSIPTDQIKISKVTPEEITDERIEEVIDVMRSYQAKWEAIEDRAIQKGDYVDLDIINLETDKKLVQNKRVEVQKGKLSEWLIDLLVGMKKDESREGTSKWDSSLPESEKKDFKATKCKVTVLGIHKGTLPPVDDAFAKAMGTQSVAELRTQVLMRLQKNAEAASENRQKTLLDDALADLVDFELPKSLMKAELDTKMKLKMQQRKDLSDSDKQKLEKETALEAEKALKLFFILQKLANDNGIIVSEEELREILSERISQLNLPKELSTNTQYKNQLIQEMRMNCFIDILTEKVRRHLLKEISYA